MRLAATTLALLSLTGIFATLAPAAEPRHPLFVDLGVETVEERANAIAEPLPGGRVLIAGGSESLTSRTAETFDFEELSFEPVPHLTRHRRRGAVASPLPDGRVLIAGGFMDVPYENAEIFDPVTEEFTDAKGEMTTPRIDAVAAPLNDGRVLIAGGYFEGGGLRSAEIFDPASETFTAVPGELQRKRSNAVATTLVSGKVLITGGDEGASLHSAEVFDPATSTFSEINSDTGNESAAAAGLSLPDGQVLLAGGISGGIPRRWAGMVDPANGAVTYLPKEGGTQLTTERWGATAAELPNGLVLISGGAWRKEASRTAELFVSAPALSATGNEMGSHSLGAQPSTATVTLTSLGGWALEIDSISLGGPDAGDFTILDDSCTGAKLYFKEICTLTVQFTRAQAGAAEARLILDDNEPVPSEVELTGSVIPPSIPENALTQPRSNPLSPTTVPKPHRRTISVRCATNDEGHSRRVKVVCHLPRATGAWEARLRRGARVVARRQLAAMPKRLQFHRPRGGHGSYRLELVPLP
jgi:hypothetical protein